MMNCHPQPKNAKITGWLLLLLLLAACTPLALTNSGMVAVSIQVDGEVIEANTPAGTTVADTLENNDIILDTLDRVEPPSYTIIAEPTTITVVRIREEYEIEQAIVPFEQQTVPNESLPDGRTMLIQLGENGLQEITYRRVFENGIETSRTVFKVVTLTEAKPEIVMIGVQSPFTPISIPGVIAYLTAGNAWVMSNTTGERRPIVTTGDLDGRVFTLSPTGEWLLYTRKSEGEEKSINTLWVVRITDDEPEPFSLDATNIIHFAAWVPSDMLMVLYSTVEPRATAPGWQANNDLRRIRFSENAYIRDEEIMEANSGGIYGWWGMNFAISPDGAQVAYSRPDSVGLVDLESGATSTLLDLLPLQTGGDWAWAPGISWAPDQQILYSPAHVPMSGLANPEASPLFNLSAIVLDNGAAFPVVSQTGMFAYPAASPDTLPGDRYLVAYLKAILPEQSDTSRYQLVLMDRDGSNQKLIYPPEGMSGLEPQQVVWAPATGDEPLWLAFIYQGNLYLYEHGTDKIRQVTGDGLIDRIDWK